VTCLSPSCEQGIFCVTISSIWGNNEALNTDATTSKVVLVIGCVGDGCFGDGRVGDRFCSAIGCLG